MRSIQPFRKGHLDDVLRSCLAQIKSRIHAEQENYLLNVNETEYIDHLVSEFSIIPPEINTEGLFITSDEKMIQAEHHPQSFWVTGGEVYKRQVVIYHLPFSGDLQMMDYIPNPHLVWTEDFNYENDSEGEFLTFEIINFSNDAEKVKRDADYTLGNLKTQMGHIKNQINGYNTSLRGEIENKVQERKKDLLSKSDFLSNLGVPVHKKEGVSNTFAVPAPSLPRKIIPKPAPNPSGKTEPTLDEETYIAILKVIHDVGKAIERMPSTYEGKPEEALRDHLLMFLEPQFQGSATGETFNKSGKTDILLRYENNNVFIGECKYWSGESKYLDTIDQILKYLTWRDSKAAIILFVKNEDFSSVIQSTREASLKHANHLSCEGEQYEGTWQTYKIHLNGDKGRPVYLTVLLFHFPPIKEKGDEE